MKRGWREIEEAAMQKPFISPRCTWTEREDALLTQLAAKYHGKKWRLVAEAVSELDESHTQHKTAKQCRERWHSHLNPEIVAAPWGVEEQTKLFAAHKVVGNKWSVIAEDLPGRTDNAIKNFFFCRLRKLARNVKNGVLEVTASASKEEAEQMAYLLDHLYKFYISPEHEQNILKTVYPRIMGRKNQGDKYIVEIMSKGSMTPDHFDKYIKSFLATLQPEAVQHVLKVYPQFTPLSPSETDDSFVHKNSPKVPLLPPLMAPISSPGLPFFHAFYCPETAA